MTQAKHTVFHKKYNGLHKEKKIFKTNVKMLKLSMLLLDIILEEHDKLKAWNLSKRLSKKPKILPQSLQLFMKSVIHSLQSSRFKLKKSVLEILETDNQEENSKEFSKLIFKS